MNSSGELLSPYLGENTGGRTSYDSLEHQHRQSIMIQSVGDYVELISSLCQPVVKPAVLRHSLISWKYALTKLTTTTGTLKYSNTFQIMICGTQQNAFARSRNITCKAFFSILAESDAKSC